MKKTKYTLILFFIIAMIGCGKDEETPKQIDLIDDIEIPPSPFFFSGTVNGNLITYRDKENNILNIATSDQGDTTLTSKYKIIATDFSRINRTISDTDTISFVRVIMCENIDTPVTSMEVYNMFAPGTYSYGVRDSSIDGAHVTWFEEGAKEWSSDLGISDQMGSTFSITERGTYNGDSSLFTFKATFSCKLYDGLGNSRVMQNATVSGQVGPHL